MWPTNTTYTTPSKIFYRHHQNGPHTPNVEGRIRQSCRTIDTCVRGIGDNRGEGPRGGKWNEIGFDIHHLFVFASHLVERMGSRHRECLIVGHYGVRPSPYRDLHAHCRLHTQYAPRVYRLRDEGRKFKSSRFYGKNAFNACGWGLPAYH